MSEVTMDKLATARTLALLLADRTDSDVEPEDVEWYTPEQVYDWLADWGYAWDDGAWVYEGAL